MSLSIADIVTGVIFRRVSEINEKRVLGGNAGNANSGLFHRNDPPWRRLDGVWPFGAWVHLEHFFTFQKTLKKMVFIFSRSPPNGTGGFRKPNFFASSIPALFFAFFGLVLRCRGGAG